MEAEVPRKLGEKELNIAAKRLVTKIEMLKGFESRKRSITRELNSAIKQTRAEIDAMSSQIATGVEIVKQGRPVRRRGARRRQGSAPEGRGRERAREARDRDLAGSVVRRVPWRA
jgi:hypothetical protein